MKKPPTAMMLDQPDKFEIVSSVDNLDSGILLSFTDSSMKKPPGMQVATISLSPAQTLALIRGLGVVAEAMAYEAQHGRHGRECHLLEVLTDEQAKQKYARVPYDCIYKEGQ